MHKDWNVVAAVVVGLVAMSFSGDAVRALPLPARIADIPYARSTLAYLVDIALMLLLLRFFGGVGLPTIREALALHRPWRSAALMGVCLFVPATLVMLVFGAVSRSNGPVDLVFGGLVFPLAEEVTYRGLATGILLLVCRWTFWAAALLPAAIFGFAHAAQGSGIGEVGAIVAITGLGGLFFSWLYVRFGNNLWPAFVLHAGLNTLWSAFDLGENALGGWLGNGLRIAVVLGAALFAWKGLDWLRRISGERRAA